MVMLLMGKLKRMSDVLGDIEHLTARLDELSDNFYGLVEHFSALEQAVETLITESLVKSIKIEKKE